QRASPQKAKLWSALADQKVPEDLPEQLAAAVANATAPESTRKHGQAIIQKAAQLLPGLVGGSADLDPSTFTYVKDGGDVQAENYAGRNIHFGVREHGMGAVVNGFAYDGFFLPYSATFLLFADYMRPPIRLAALSKLHSIFVFTHDSIFLGEDALVDVEDPDLVVVATGSEVSTSQQALQFFDKSLKVRLVSMPCVERFLRWPGEEQRRLIPHGRAKMVAVEAAGGLDWYRIIGDGLMVGIDRFGASAPEKALADAYDLTPHKVAGRISKWLEGGGRTNTK